MRVPLKAYKIFAIANESVYNMRRNEVIVMDAVAHEKIYTIEDIYALPDGQRAELIDGQIYYMAAPNTRHQRLVADIFYRIRSFIESNNGICEPFVSPFAVFLNSDDKTYVEPDISVICDPDKITDKGCNGAPDWVIEIVSLGSHYMDYMRKLSKYEAAGVREYWIVDPDKEHITIYDFQEEIIREYSFGEDIPVGIYEGFTIKVE